MTHFFVYILKCSDGSYYIGHTDDIEIRMAKHKAGRFSGYTSTRLPVELVFSAIFESRDQAFIIERRIKRWSRKKKEALIQGDYESLKLYAQKKDKD